MRAVDADGVQLRGVGLPHLLDPLAGDGRRDRVPRAPPAGLANVLQRLRLIYGEDEVELTAGRLDDGRFRVRLAFPQEAWPTRSAPNEQNGHQHAGEKNWSCRCRFFYGEHRVRWYHPLPNESSNAQDAHDIRAAARTLGHILSPARQALEHSEI